ncbi:histidine phosphatase superfamily [Mucor mucedo]|uniref:histidine phosphatase superfamily n=1 Tax=Mucor mucedo TaxID=29922 RepID=UPI0022210825|nr:histidine phosphatase superfamily [Mucor mucedo]KAI7880252.1 histidine phosphatase superfamily [Mucor mucedo]
MVLKEIWVARHGFREDWVNDNPPLPTNLRNDPPLSDFGRQQSLELAAYLKDKSIDRIYSSPFYRVLETVYPLVLECDMPLFIDNAMAEWYGLTHGRYLPCAPLPELKKLFPKLNIEHHSSSIPLPTEVETEHDCHLRVKKGLDILVDELDSDKGQPQTILLSGHAASAICAVRALLNDSHFYVNTGTCSLSRLIRQDDKTWKIMENGDCSHLSQGEQRSWMFSGDVPDYELK